MNIINKTTEVLLIRTFEFAPDQVMLFPQKLMYRRTKWAEVAP